MNGNSRIGDMIRFSWAKSREILFPFHFKRWLKVLVIVWLAGAGIQGCSANFRLPKRPVPSSGQNTFVRSSFGTPPQAVMQPSPIPSDTKSSNSVPQKIQTTLDRVRSQVNLTALIGITAGILFFWLGLAVFFAWLSSRFNFVLLDVILRRDPAIKASFREHGETGNWYFVWTLVLMGAGLGVFLLAALFLILTLGIMKGSPVLGVPLLILGGLLGVVAGLALVLAGNLMRDFILPIMYREKIPVMSALNKFLKAGAFTWGKIFQYLLLVFGLWIAAMIVQGLVGILTAIVGLIAGGLIAIPGIVLVKLLPFLTIPLSILGGLIGAALLLVVIAVIGIVMLPVTIFFRVLALTYLTRLYPGCDLLGFSGKSS